MLKLMKRHKIVSGVLIVVVAVIVALVAFRSVWTGMIKSAVLKQISAMTGTKVTFESFSFAPIAGSVEIRNFVVGNPEGYHTEHALRFDALAVDLDVGSLFSDTIVIETILVDGLQVTFETGFTENNLLQIKKNIDAYSKTEKKAVEEKTPEKAPEGTKKKFIIKKLDVVNCEATVAAKMIKNKAATLKMPDIHLTGIGEKSGGATAAEVADIIINGVIDSTDDVVDGTNSVIKAGKGVIDDVNDKAKKAVDSLKNMF